MRNDGSIVAPLLLLAALSALPAQAQQPRPLTPAPQPGTSTAAAPAANAGGDLKAIKRQLAAMQKLVNGLRAELKSEATARAGLEAAVASLRTQVQAANDAVRALRANSVLDLNGYVSFDNSSGYPTVLFNGINVQVVNGTGATQSVNGLGNVILGYNRPRSTEPLCSLGYFNTQVECVAHGGVWARSHKSGSHNLVGGDYNAYSSWGGLVFGLENAIAAPYAAIGGGAGNVALGDLSAVAGGSMNAASGMYAVVNGGLSNAASGAFASVGGGSARQASDPYRWAAGALTQDR
jgi:hypothetical protein